jgi:uncharacterized membrane protein
MSSIAIFLVLLSAFMHAGWNLLSKRVSPSAGFFLLTTLPGLLVLVPVAILNRDLLNGMSQAVWILLIVAGFFQAVYFSGLAGAYRSGDMSIAYPLARAVPVLLVMLISLLRGRGEQLTPLGLVGMLLVVIGCIILPLVRLRSFHPQRYINPATGFALVAALGTTGYSITDDAALRMLRQAPEMPSVLQVTLLYILLEILTTAIWLLVFILLRKESRASLRDTVRQKAPRAFLAGLVITTTYLLVLISLAFVRDVSYVVAFRQVSILVGTLLGVLVLKEASHPPKFIGVGLIFCGLVLVALG